ncbi:ribokinase [Planktotalea frisia]|jgi:ribokinase|uniref:Ribokinase n=1 Tax=Planktotalea frisia TaxID=696762 RepID=A0A1L9NUN0_9RHOB|nr:carbohydrate kinase family protein [Planktotalea frisia]OJI92854.1 ribokinase [Planktotalea frisia]PZX25228.1 ribokinase [Planktotalea frisia]
MNTLCVTGYASLDYVLDLASSVSPDQTSHATRLPNAWPRLGGCPTYISMAVAQIEGASMPVTWVGDDPQGTQLVNTLTQSKVNTDGIAIVTDASSPTAVMLYQPDGSCACIYDPGHAGRETLSAAQEAAIAGASHLCISVGPPHLTEQILALRAPSTRLYWAVKNDPACFTPAICNMLCQSADVIFCNAAERKMIGPTSAVVVLTMGSKGVLIEENGSSIRLPVAAFETHDTTGAGDSFAGGYIAAEMTGAATSEAAAQAGIDTASRLLCSRQKENTV